MLLSTRVYSFGIPGRDTLKALIILSLIWNSFLWAGSCYDDLASEFGAATLPLESAVKGYWGGNCVTTSEPEAYWPAVLAVKDASTSRGTTLSYFWERNTDRDLFRNMSPSEVENYKPVKEWFAKEQWNSLKILSGSLANEYATTSSQKMLREIRWEENDANSRILMRVKRITGTKEETTLYCEFDKTLSGSTPSTPPSTPPGGGGTASANFVFGMTGAVRNQTFILNNPSPTSEVERLQFLNLGITRLILQNMIITFEDGTTANGPVITLPGRAGFEIKRNSRAPKLIESIEFQVLGSSNRGVEVRALGTP